MAWLHTHSHTHSVRDRVWLVKEKPMHWAWVIFAIFCTCVGAEEAGFLGAIVGFVIASCIIGVCGGAK